MNTRKPGTPASEDKPSGDCHEPCVIGLEECAECGICEHCSDGTSLDEDTLPSHWQKFIENSRKKD
ncbi:MAG TPA: hypothetical protein VHC46_09945 [Thermodesulfobacteriota bacterium]|nr:hypothetical protein [Thermodesulfobacteriota bacterium]